MLKSWVTYPQYDRIQGGGVGGGAEVYLHAFLILALDEVSGWLLAPATLLPGESPRYALSRRLGVPWSRSGHSGEEKIVPLILLKIKLCILWPVAQFLHWLCWLLSGRYPSSTMLLSRQHLGTILDTLHHDQDCTVEHCTPYVFTFFAMQWHSPGYRLL